MKNLILKLEEGTFFVLKTRDRKADTVQTYKYDKCDKCAENIYYNQILGIIYTFC